MQEANHECKPDLESEYDRIARERYASGEAASSAEVAAIARALEGCGSVLDVGVGAGRLAKPLSDLGFEITGVDVSRRMLLRARGNGLDRLVLGDAYGLPFRDGAFDGTLMVHVLQSAVDWVRVAREVGRVTKVKVLAVFGPRVTSEGTAFPESGPSTGPAGGGYPWRRRDPALEGERQLIGRAPPVALERTRDEVVAISVEDALNRIDAQRPLASQMVPPEFKRAMMERMIAMTGSREVRRRIVEDLVVWRADQLADLTP